MQDTCSNCCFGRRLMEVVLASERDRVPEEVLHMVRQSHVTCAEVSVLAIEDGVAIDVFRRVVSNLDSSAARQMYLHHSVLRGEGREPFHRRRFEVGYEVQLRLEPVQMSRNKGVM
eukprot:4014096-Amphidinium_carterae.2